MQDWGYYAERSAEGLKLPRQSYAKKLYLPLKFGFQSSAKQMGSN
jgi:hypothetical protein